VLLRTRSLEFILSENSMPRRLLLLALLGHALAAPAQALEPGDYVFVTDAGVALRATGARWQQVDEQWVQRTAEIIAPWGLAIGRGGRAFVSTAAGRIYAVTREHDRFVAKAWVTGGGDLRGLWIDSAGRLLAADASSGCVVDASAGGRFDALPVIASGLGAPSALFETRDGRLLVSEWTPGEITDISAGGDFTHARPFASGLGDVIALKAHGVDGIYAVDSSGVLTIDISKGGDFAGRASNGPLPRQGHATTPRHEETRAEDSALNTASILPDLSDLSAGAQAGFAGLLTALCGLALAGWLAPDLVFSEDRS
jgi:hypothetical protein